MSSSAPRTIYLGGEEGPVCATFHGVDASPRDTAVIICPPFGWDEVCSYRSRRVWAQQLAHAGYATARFSLPATGDSDGNPRDPARLDAWTAAAESASRWLRAATGTTRTVAIGIGLGGLIAYRAAAIGAPIDDLVLWATPARGHSLIRQLRAFSRLEESHFYDGLVAPPPLPAGELEAGGFLLSAETVGELQDLDLTVAVLPNAQARRVLLLERDGIAVDDALRNQLERSGAALMVGPGEGYAAMSSHPQQARPPLELISRVTAWLDEASARSGLAPGRLTTSAASAGDHAVLTLGSGVRVRETPLTFPQPFGSLAGVLTEPLGPHEPGLCAVLLNAGAVRRIGPSRMWVEAARRWAELGVPTLRLDVEGIGDADGDEAPYVDDAGLYVPRLIPQVLATLDRLQEQGIGDRFILGGLCAGAYWAFHATLLDQRVIGAMMVNPRALIWDPGLLPARDFRALMTEPRSWRKIRRLASAARVRALSRWVLGAPRRKASQLRRRAVREPAYTNRVDGALEALRSSGKRALFLFSEGEPLRDELTRSGRIAWLEQWPNVTLDYIQVRDHTLRPNVAQQQAHAALDRALSRELRINRDSSSAGGSSPTKA